jgi:hypothetical protein
MEGIEIEELRVEDDGTWRVGFQRGPEGLVGAHHGWREARLRVEEEHLIAGPGLRLGRGRLQRDEEQPERHDAKEAQASSRLIAES